MKFGRTGRVMTRGTAWILAVVLVLCTAGTHMTAWTITAQAAEGDVTEGDCVISKGGGHSAAIKEDGSLWMWGRNSAYELGNGNNKDSSVPIKIVENVKAVSLGSDHSAAIKEDGSLWMWGSDSFRKLGDYYTYSGKPIKIMENVRTVSLGGDHSAAIKEDGSLWTWGRNMFGQLGNGTWGSYTDGCKPVKIMENVRAVSLGGDHSAAIKEDGSLWLWGDSEDAQLGNGKYNNDSCEPIKIMENVKAVSLGYDHSAAIKEDGSLWMWGSNKYGELGWNPSDFERAPVKATI